MTSVTTEPEPPEASPPEASAPDASAAAAGEQAGRTLLPIASARRTWGVLGAELRRQPGSLTLALLVILAASAAGLVAPWVLGQLVDDIRAGGGSGDVVRAIVIIGVAALVCGVLTGLGTTLIARVGETVLARLRERVLDRALHLPSATLERSGTGDLLSRVGDDASVVANTLTGTGPELVTALMTVALTSAGLFVLDWRLGLAGLLALPFYVRALQWYLPRSGPYYARERAAMGERSQVLIGSLRGRATVRAYLLETEHTARIEQRSRASMDITMGVFRLFTRFSSGVNRAEFVGLAAVLVVGFLLVRGDLATVGATTAAALYFHRLFNPLGAIVMQFNLVQSAGASLARLAGVAELPEPADPATSREPADTSVELSGVSHHYADGPRVLDEVSLRIAPGERVALVGTSGAGKTTLAGIAAGVLTATDGSVRLGGVPLSELGESRVRAHVSVLSQEVHVFSGPLVEDVRLARAEASDEQVTAALDRVGALDWVRALDGGIHCEVGENAHQLTAAQAQQLALARLVLADPGVAVLDEATAEAGSAGARELERAAAAATEGRTTLVVAHRLTQAVLADRVVVLEHGRIVEVGPHETLVGAGGRYSELWRSWAGTGADPAAEA